VLREIAACSRQGESVERVEQLADRLLKLSHDQAIMLTGTDQPIPSGVVRRADGALLDDGRVDRLFTTRELLAAEHTVLTSMHTRANDNAAVVPERRVHDLIASHRVQLTDDQQSMVESLTTSGAGMEVVVGIAGAGKTHQPRRRAPGLAGRADRSTRLRARRRRSTQPRNRDRHPLTHDRDALRLGRPKVRTPRARKGVSSGRGADR